MPSIAVYSSGTTGLQDGTAVSLADAETAPYAFAALDTSYTLHYRVIEPTTGSAAYYQTTSSFTMTCPSGVQVSTDEATWSGTVSFPAATPYNQPLYIQQTDSAAGAEADLEVGTGGVVFETDIWPYVWSDDFGDASIDAALWRTEVANSGTVTESGGSLLINTMDSTTKQALAAAVKPVKMTYDGTLTVVGLQGNETVAVSRAMLVADDDWTIADWATVANNTLVFDCTIAGPGYVTAPGQWSLRYKKPDNTTMYWDHAGDQWTSTGTYNASTTFANDDEFTWVVEIDATNSQSRQLLYKGETLVTTTDYVASTDTREWGSDLYLSMIDSSTSVYRDLTWTDVDYGATT